MPQPIIDARKMMELTIEAMRQSVSEQRDDDKVSPRVGALIYKPDGTVETASRGELRYGDHAEYTLLERKNRNSRLEGSYLFTSLEPCAPGSRSHPKLSCAERIYLARIKEVWVGVEDPDPTVDRKGIKYLQDRGVKVHMFDRDLQEIIFRENKICFEQAMERAALARKPPSKEIVLSEFENPVSSIDWLDDMSSKALKQYQEIVKKENMAQNSFYETLVHQGVLKKENGQLIPTGFGIMLFGNEPRTFYPQAGLLATINYTDGSEDTKDFDGPMVQIPGQLEKWFNDKIPSIIDRNRAQRRVIPAFPFKPIREAVVNALVHRDYSIRGAKCHLIITPDTIIIRSPGHPPLPITIEQLRSFNAPVLSRNPELHYVFAQMKLAEERGLGMKTFNSFSNELVMTL